MISFRRLEGTDELIQRGQMGSIAPRQAVFNQRAYSGIAPKLSAYPLEAVGEGLVDRLGFIK